MHLYNTPAKAVETITPQTKTTTTIYTCGPTVYDYPHIGNWFTFIRYDLLVRTLRLDGHKTKWIMNITDVGHLVSDGDDGEDKLEKGAKREGKTAWDVAAYYGQYFTEALGRLNILPPNGLPKATDHIPEQIALIAKLEANGFTYVIDDGVYYDTSKFAKYATFAGLDLEDQQSSGRVAVNIQKRNPSDFALWKFSPADQTRDMEWESPWQSPRTGSNKGFPGWHIECSAMAMKYLGTTIDIHAGGIDHIPVHHTNEIAQSQGATGKQFVNYWMHTNHISVEGEKISKSLGNSITLEDIEAKGISLQAFRLHVLESHYRTQSKFSWESLKAAQNRLTGFQRMADLRFQASPDATPAGDLLESSRKRITKLLANDLGTPGALSVLNEAVTFFEAHGLHVSHIEDGSFMAFLDFIDRSLGLELATTNDITASQKERIAAREAARAEQNWELSDQIRNELAADGIGLKDVNKISVWYRL